MQVQWWSILPFVALLLAIAVCPLVKAISGVWERNLVKLAVALLLGLPIAIWFVIAGASGEVIHALVEYAQFIILLLALFVVSGGVYLAGHITPSARNNTIILAIGGVIASFIGTTGAAMLLIRPLLNINHGRAHRAHTVIFTIFIVANCGGLLTPLGDPPLFLGMLRGVPFSWTFTLLGEWFFVNALLLLSYYALDRRYQTSEKTPSDRSAETASAPLRVEGAWNLAFFAMIVVAVAFLPSIDLGAIEAGRATWVQVVPWRELVMLGAAAASYLTGQRRIRYDLNQFSWTPIAEVAALFVGIFLTMIPALNYLGQVADKLPLNKVTMFIFTGGISGVLDNAPTYATFFEIASALPGEPRVAGVPEALLVSVSLGAVLGGCLTYIGNGPNFMVRSVAVSTGVEMPSFGGYIVQSMRFVMPVLVAMMLLFIADGVWWSALGVVLSVAIVIRAVWMIPRETRITSS